MKAEEKKSDFELIMEAIDALPPGQIERKPADPEKIRVRGDRDAFMKAIDKDSYRVKCALGSFIDDLDEDFIYNVSAAGAAGNARIKVAMKAALEDLPVSLAEIPEMLFCICCSGFTAYDIGSVVSYLQELPEDISIDWGIAIDEDIPEDQVKVILVAV